MSSYNKVLFKKQVSLILAIILTLSAINFTTNINAASISGSSNWNIETTIYKLNDTGENQVYPNPDTTTEEVLVVKPGDNLRYNLSLNKITTGAAITDTIKITLSNEIFNLDGSFLNVLSPAYPNSGGGNIKIFTDDSFKNSMLSPDGKSYIYTLHFNQSPEAILAFENEILTNVDFNLWLDIRSDITTNIELVPLIIEDNNNVTVKVEPDPLPETNGVPVGTKTVAQVIRDGIVIGNNSSTAVIDGDYIKFNIGAKNITQDAKAQLLKLYEDLPIGYTADVVKNGKQRTDIGSGWILSNPQPNNLVSGTVRYEFIFKNPLLINQGATWGYIPFFATVNDSSSNGNSWTDSEITNLVTADTGTNIEGGVGPNKPEYNAVESYDLALQIFLSQNGTTGQNKFEYFKNNTKVYFAIKLSNQGNAPVYNTVVSFYVPRGYMLDPSYNYIQNGVSELKNEFTQNDSSLILGQLGGLWTSDLKVYQYTFKNILPAGSSVQTISFPLIAIDRNDDVRNENNIVTSSFYKTLQDSDYYIASEIGHFEDMYGKRSSDNILLSGNTSEGQIVDIDSTPDENPFNDLISNLDGNTIYYIYSQKKEKPSNIYQNGKSNTKIQDEDDFDFEYVIPTEGILTDQDNNALIKSRLTDYSPDLTNPYGNVGAQENIFKSIIGNSNFNNNFSSYKAVNDTEAITNPKSYMIYELWVNYDGDEYTVTFPNGTTQAVSSVLKDNLPNGLKIASFNDSGTGKKTYAVGVDRYFTTNRTLVGTTGTYVIDWSHGIATEVDTPIGFLNSNVNNYTGIINNSNNIYGLNMDITNNDKNLNINFSNGKINTEGDYTKYNQFPDPYNELFSILLNRSCAAYRIRMAVLIDTDNINYQEIFNNKASYQYNAGTENAIEKSEEFWALSSSSATIRKYVLPTEKIYDINGNEIDPSNLNSNDWLGFEDINIIDPIDRIAVYKIRLRSASGFDINKINIADDVNHGAIPKIVDSVYDLKVTGFEGVNGYDSFGELINPTILNENAVNVDLKGTVININNKDFAITGTHQYNVTFKVKYNNNLKFGERVLNNASGSIVKSINPLKINVFKNDADDSSKILTGYEFNAYYLNSNGNPDISNPVLDYKNNPVTVTSTNNSFYFVPKDYTDPSKSAINKWTIALVETKSPDVPVGTPPYYNFNNAYLLYIDKNTTTGKLTVSKTLGQSNNINNNFTVLTDTITGENNITIENKLSESININLDKKMILNNNISLSGYEFKAYYIDSVDEKVDINVNDEVLDLQGNPVVFKDDKNIHLLTMDYNHINGGKWHVALIETKSPDNYTDEIGNEFTYTKAVGSQYNIIITKTNFGLVISNTDDGLININQVGEYDTVSHNNTFNIDLYNVPDDKIGFTVNKIDADTQQKLTSGYVFKAYYQDSNKKADYTRPFKDINGNEVQVNSENSSAILTPEGYYDDSITTWNLVWVETSVPDLFIDENGFHHTYVNNIGKEYPMEISKNSDGTLIINNIYGPNHDNALTFNLKNDTDGVVNIEIGKKDFETGEQLEGYKFEAFYKDLNGNANLKNPVKDIYNNPAVVYYLLSDTGIPSIKGNFAFTPNSTLDKIEIVLVETYAPNNYSANKGKEFGLTIIKDSSNGQWIVQKSNVKSEEYDVDNSNSTIVNIKNKIDSIASINITKQDSSNGKILSDYEFLLYYADEMGKLDENKPVFDLNGNQIIFYNKINETGSETYINESSFIPENYSTQNNWKIILKETNTPIGYTQHNTNKEFIFDLTKSESGKLKLVPHLDSVVEGENPFNIIIKNVPDDVPPVEGGGEKPFPSPKPSPSFPNVTLPPTKSPTIYPSESPNVIKPLPTISPLPTDKIPNGYVVKYDKDKGYYVVIGPDGLPKGYVKNINDFISIENIIPFGNKNNPNTGQKTNNKIPALILLVIISTGVILIKKNKYKI